MDDAGEVDIYKIDQLEIMLLANAAWQAITPETVTNCWSHTGIQP